MGILEEVKRMQASGMPESQIVTSLRERGVPYKDISDAFSQTKIRAAVDSPVEDLDVPSPEDSFPQDSFGQGQFQDQNFDVPPPSGEPMQEYAPQSPQMPEYSPPEQSQYPPVPSPDSGQFQPYDNSYPQYSESYPQEQYSQDYSPAPADYSGYDYQSGVSPDTISEIAEQILSEKMSDLRKKFEKSTDFKNTAEAKINSIEERLKRIEKIIDTLQTSVLRKVGDYITNVDDIKKELIETQKSFTKLLPELKEKAHSHSTHKTHKTTHRKKSHK